MPRHFNFIGSDADYVDQTGFGMDLGETPSLSVLSQLLEDLYLQRRLNPGYLFVSKDDSDALTDEVTRNTCFCGPFGGKTDEESPRVSDRCVISKICNQTTGRLIDLVPLPGMAHGKVIVGFFL
jgi:hypothetical protein